MAHAEKCPVCNGSGKIEAVNPYNYGSSSLKSPVNIITCHGCNGFGWVTVKDENVSRDTLENKLVNNNNSSSGFNSKFGNMEEFHK